jgi:hypothetical protein
MTLEAPGSPSSIAFGTKMRDYLHGFPYRTSSTAIGEPAVSSTAEEPSSMGRPRASAPVTRPAKGWLMTVRFTKRRGLGNLTL